MNTLFVSISVDFLFSLFYNLNTGSAKPSTKERGNLMELYKELSMLYVQKHATVTSTPEELLAMYRDALEKITKCDKEHNGKTFSFE